MQPSSRLGHRLFPFASAALALCLAQLAHADEKNPAVEACNGKTDGAPCSAARAQQDAEGNATNRAEPGTCQPDECCTLDYSSGSPPKSVCGPCLACKPGAPSSTGDTTPSSSAGGEPPRTEDGPPAHEPAKKGCSIDDAPTGGALSVMLWLALVRRSRRSNAAR